MTGCAHLGHVRLTALPDSVEGCEGCLHIGDPWLHLRICLECGYVGCCDDSPNRHARGHAKSAAHPIIRSLEPGEEWSWCFIDEIGLTVPRLHGETGLPPSPLGDSIADTLARADPAAVSPRSPIDPLGPIDPLSPIDPPSNPWFRRGR
jgi:hypothetical protein